MSARPRPTPSTPSSSSSTANQNVHSATTPSGSTASPRRPLSSARQGRGSPAGGTARKMEESTPSKLRPSSSHSNEAAKTAVDVVKQKEQEHQEAIKALEEELERMKARSKGLEKENGELIADRAREEETRAERENELDVARDKIKDLERDVKDSEKRYEEQESHFIKQQDGWNVARKEIESRLSIAQAERGEAVAFAANPGAQAQEPPKATAGNDQNVADPTSETANTIILTQLRTQLHSSQTHSLTLESSLSNANSALAEFQTRFNHHDLLLKQTNEELEEMKGICERLREENGVWEGMVRERTVAGTMAFGVGSGLGLVEEEKEEGVGSGSAEEVGNDEDAEREKRRARRRLKGKSLMDEMRGLEVSEIGDAEDQIQEVEEVDPLKQEVTALKTEIKNLKEDNKRHLLYITRILTIIAERPEIQELLAQANSAPEQSRRISVRPASRGQRPSTSRITSSSSTRSVSGTPTEFTSPNPGLSLTGASTPPIVQRPAADPKTGLRPLSMLMGPVGDLQLPAEKAKEDEELKQKEREAAAEKRAKRGLSLNWSSFAGFGSSAPAKLSPRTEDPSFTEEPEAIKEVPSPRREGSNSPLGTKLEPQEEDEEDRIERERLAVTMKMLGVSPVPSRGSSGATSPAASSSTLVPPETVPPRIRRSNSVMSTSSARSSDVSSRTPLSRLSSFFGRSPVASAADESASENEDLNVARGDLAEIVQQAAKEREEEERQKFARKRGWRQSLFAKPEVLDEVTGRDRRESDESMGSLEEMRSPTVPVDMGHLQGEERKTSITTLFDAST